MAERRLPLWWTCGPFFDIGHLGSAGTPGASLRPRRLTWGLSALLRYSSPIAVAALMSLAPAALRSQSGADSALVSYIAGIKAVDSHAHPMRYVGVGTPPDSEYDALPLDAIPPFQVPWRLRPDNPQWRQAQRALFGPLSPETGAAYSSALARAKARIVTEQAQRFPTWVLDQTGIDVMLANRIVLGEGLASPRFRWVPFADPLMFPLDSRNAAARTPDTRSLYPKEDALLRRYLRDLGLSRIPATLDTYVASVIRPTLARQRQGGAVAIKFEAAYLRALDFDPPDPAAARRVYGRYSAGGTPTNADYKLVQDYLFRLICREAGRLGMAVQIHLLEGFGGFYSPRGSAPRLLESALNDSTLRATNFVIVHGGWPLIGETQSLLARSNVFADISAMVLIVDPGRLAQVLRQWLAEWPEKVLFGSDAFDGGPEQGWAEVAWVGTTTARRALAEALTGMMRSGDLDRARAQEVARMVMRQNAIEAYHLAAQ
ncbi:MAG: amidohydrolase [Gemmatimonadaceae bacterium]